MLVQSERDIDLAVLLNDLKFKIDKCDKHYKILVHKQLLIDCYDVIRKIKSEEDDMK